MANINIEQLIPNMLSAAEGPLQKQWPAARDYAANEFKLYLFQVQHIADLKVKGQISEDEARFLLDQPRLGNNILH